MKPTHSHPGSNAPAAAAARRTLLILHGVNGSRSEMESWRMALKADFNVETLELDGHGGRPVPDELTVAGMAQDVLAQIDRRALQAPLIIGYSFGGVIALYLAIHHPSRVAGVVTVATRWIYDMPGLRHATHVLGVERIAAQPERSALMAKVHYPNPWRLVAERVVAMYRGFLNNPPFTIEGLQGISCPCLLLSGSADPIASADETVALHRVIPGSEIALYPGIAHPVENVPVGGLQRAVQAWAGRQFP